jgi:peptidoglycan/xylan/chitin deacetylase (PgdA/CDA1 family)
MSGWKDGIRNAYRYATWPWRHAYLNRMVRAQTVPIAIVFYHRVADEHPNPWTITSSVFQQQIDWLQAHYDLISLDEVQRRIASGNARPSVSITFDGGYADNCNRAIPLLVERGIPVTYFVTTHHTVHNKPFPHDVSRQLPLPSNSIESLRALVNAGVEIGSHTRSHLNLAGCTDTVTLFNELIAATLEMESMIDRPIRYFAFPFGQKNDLNPAAFQLLAEHGFSAVCSAYGGYNAIHGDRFHLQRIHGDPNLSRFKNWLTFDPRVLQVERYDWESRLPVPPSKQDPIASPTGLVESDV